MVMFTPKYKYILLTLSAKQIFSEVFVNILRRFFINGFIMSVTSLVLRAVSVAFNAFLSRQLGADGMGLFTLIMSVYGLAVTVAASGVNLAATRMCAEALGRGDGCEVRAALRRCLTYASTCGCVACVLLIAGAEGIAEYWLCDVRCIRSLRLLALSLPFIAVSNVLGGYFTAVRRVVKNAICQIFEQLCKVFITVWALLYFVPEGIEYACMAIVGGGAVAESCSFVLALILYLFDRRKVRDGVCKKADGKRLTKTLFGITVPVATAAYIRSGLSTLEHMLIPRGLRKNPATADAALATYGIVCGMVMPILMFPTALLYSFTALLVPEFAGAAAENNRVLISRMTYRTVVLTMVFSVGTSALMYIFADELGMLVYQSADAGMFIRIMSPLVPVMYLDHAVDAMLKGLGEQLYCMKINILDAAVCTLLVWILCPRIGIYGYIVTIYLAEIMNASLSIARLVKVTEFRSDISEMLFKPLLSGGICMLVFSVTGIVDTSFGWICFIGLSALFIVLYVIILYLLGCRELKIMKKQVSAI